MDPTDAELQLITNLDEGFKWAGVQKALREALLAALGQPQRVREVSLVPRCAIYVWDKQQMIAKV